MHFKRMSIQGFKSFAQPVTIDFHQGITCIVGPNGSGKSNISDALRWVLGEQSPRTLRGGKMDEVIFAGTSASKSRGMAEVTLVIDNTDNSLPVDFSEVAITRRLYRSGESEYLINNTNCRLKDIRETIVDTGIGVEGYSIIGQGKIDEIINSKPESRREIFEEAAGVVKYRNRKEEAEKKLEATNMNLLRVNDIIKEIENRKESLETESEKAAQYLELITKYKEAEINVTLKNIEIIELKNEYIEDDIQEANSNIEYHKKEKERLEEQLTGDRNRSKELEDKDIAKRDEFLKLIGELNTLDNRLSINKEKLTSIETRRCSYQGDIEALEQKLEKEKSNLSMLENDDTDIEGRLSKLQDDMSARIEDYDRQIMELESVHDYEKEKAGYDRLVSEEKNIAATVNGMLNELSHNRSRKDILEELENSYEGYNHAVKFIMNDHSLQGIEGVVADLIEVPEGYETAISIALGAQLQNIVCRDDKTARAAILALKDSKAGRLTFLPMQSIRNYDSNNNKTSEDVREMTGFIGMGTECIKYNSKFDNIMGYLLGKILIIDKLANAIAVSKRVRGNYRFVTLDGEIINNSGAITGGASKSNKTNILERKNEINKLEKYLEHLQIRCDEKRTAWESLRRKLKEKTTSLENYEQSFLKGKKELTDKREDTIMRMRMESGNVIAEKNNITRMSRHIIEGINEIEADISFRHESIQKLVVESERIVSEYDSIEALITKKKNEKRELEIQIDGIKAERKSITGNLTELEREKADADKNVFHYQTQKYELELKLEKNKAQIDTYKNKIWDDFEISYVQAIQYQKRDFIMADGQKEARILKNRIKALGNVNINSISEFKTLKERYDFLIDQRNDLTQSIKTLKEIIENMDKTIRISFKETFDTINNNFQQVFSAMFGGGSAELWLDDESRPLESGIEITAQPPGKKLQNINLLSGGEKTLTAIAMMFAVLKTKPTPFCVLDEVEAALDESNIERFAEYLKGFSDVQFVLITHQKATMEHANVLYGITMPEKGISKIFSLKLTE